MGGLTRQFLNACQAISFSIEGRLEAADRRGAVLQHLLSPTHAFGFKLVQRTVLY